MKDERIRNYLNIVNDSVHSHVIFYTRKDSDVIVPCNVRFSDNIYELRKNILFNKSEIKEIYNFQLDIDEQLKEEIAYHIEPFLEIETTEEELQKALDFATKAHENQKRKDGRPYIVHPIRVAGLVSKYYKGKYAKLLMECAYLHDVIEDSNLPLELAILNLVSIFGPRVTSIVFELTNDPKLKKEYGKEIYLEEKMLYMSSLALVVKLCDRLDNVCDLHAASIEFKNKVISETINIINYVISKRILDYSHAKIINDILLNLSKLEISKDQEFLINDMQKSMESKPLIDSLMLKLSK